MAGTNKKKQSLKWKSINQLKTSYNTKVRFCPMLSDVLKSIALFDGSQAMPGPAFSSNKNGGIKDENEWDSLVERFRLEKTEVLGEQPRRAYTSFNIDLRRTGKMENEGRSRVSDSKGECCVDR